MERYHVIQRDSKGRPTLLRGLLSGCVQERHEFTLSGRFMYWRKDSFRDVSEAMAIAGYRAETKKVEA